MSQTSDWPLGQRAERHLLPQPVVRRLAKNPLTSSCYPLAAGYYPQAHGHQMMRQQPSDYLVIYCISGQAALDTAQGRREITAGNLLLLPPGHWHRYQAATKDPWSLYWMHLQGHQLTALLALFAAEQGTTVTIGMQDHLLADFRALLGVIAGGYAEPSLLHASHLCQSLLSHAWLVLRHRQQGSEALDIQAVHALMAQHLDRRLQLAELAEAAGYHSPWQFIRHYRQATGQTPMQAFLHRKINQASYLLETTELPINLIAERLGFDDPYYFSRLFRKLAGISPTQYRRHGAPAPARQ